MIDVIIPVYNGHDFLDIALSSIAKQTIKDKLYIYIIDDGSKCIYDDIIEKYKNSLSIKLIRSKKNKGQAVARQSGIEISKNEFITFVDCDDELPYDALEKLFLEISKDSSLQVVSGYTNVNGKKKYYLGSMCGRIFRRSFIEKYKIKCNCLYNHEDCMFMQKVYYLCSPKEYLIIDDIVYNYNKGLNDKSSSKINNDSKKNILSFIRAYNIAVKFAKKYHKYENIKQLSSVIFYQIWQDLEKCKNDLKIEDYTIVLNKINKFYKKNKKEIEYSINLINDNKFRNFYLTLDK